MNARRLSFAELQKEVLEALRSQNPDWVQADGDSPIYHNYEARLAELLGLRLPPAGEEAQGLEAIPTDLTSPHHSSANPNPKKHTP